jgi:hypothetical protein
MRYIICSRGRWGHEPRKLEYPNEITNVLKERHSGELLVRRWIEMADSGFTGDFGAFFTPDYQGHVSGRMHMDLMELQRLERGFAAAFSPVTRVIDDLFSVDDKVVLRITTRATHS